MIWYTDSRTSVCPSSTVPTGWAKPLAEGSAEEVEVGVVAGVERECERDMMEVVLVAEAKLRVLQSVEALVLVLMLMLVLALALELDGDGDELEVVDGVGVGVGVGELGVDEVFGGVYFGVVEVVVVVGSWGAEPEPNDHEPWSTPASVLPPDNLLKRPMVRSRPLAPQPMHCGGEYKVGNYLNERRDSPYPQ